MLAAKLKKNQTYEEYLPTVPWDEGFICSPKLDGIRIVVHPELGAVTRSLKPIPNKALRAFFEKEHSLLSGFDGELIYGNHESSDYSFQKTQSKVMTHDETIEGISFHVFDDCSFLDRTFFDRINHLNNRLCGIGKVENPLEISITEVPQLWSHSLKTTEELEQAFLKRNYEGLMFRHNTSLYKQGRSTLKQMGLVAVKRFEDCEGKIVGFEALERNYNEATTDALGYTVRSASQENKIADDLMGRMKVMGIPGTPFDGMTFYIGSGFDKATRIKIWHNQTDYLGKLVTFTYQSYGVKEKPRAPIFKGFCNDR